MPVGSFFTSKVQLVLNQPAFFNLLKFMSVAIDCESLQNWS